MATLGTYFYDGTSFQFATGLWINASLTTVAPDGWYSQGGIYRYMSSGILGSPQTCASCIYSCGDPAIGWTAGGMGKMIITVDVGIATGAVIAKFNLTNDSSIARATWTYDGLSASEYSSANYGYVQGVLGNEINGILYGCIDNATGSGGNTFTGTEYTNTGSTFVPSGNTPTWGPYLDQASGGCDLINSPTPNYGDNIMVIPKPNTTPSTIEFVIDGPLCSQQRFSLEVLCPTTLISFNTVNYSNVDCTDACFPSGAPVPGTYYLAPVAGVGGIPTVNDWVFSDNQGVSAAPDGFYTWIDGATFYCLTVVNGVITLKTLC